MRINLICLLGASLGIVCLLLPWAVDSLHDLANGRDSIIREVEVRPSPFFTLPSGPSEEAIAYLNIAAAFLVGGSLLTFLSPLGGLSQLAGVVLFGVRLKAALPDLNLPPPFIPGFSHILSYKYEFSIGYYLAVLATACTLSSILLSVTIDSKQGFKPKASIVSSIKGGLRTFRRSSE